MITHVLKDGTVLEDVSSVTVPQEVTKRVVAIMLDVRKERKKNEKND